MSEPGAPSAAPAATPASAPSEGAGQAPANDNAVNPASEAARTLAARRNEIRAQLSKPKESSTTKEGADAAGAKSPDSVSPPTTGTDSDDIAALIREDRRLKSEAKRIEISKAELKEYEEEVTRARAARDALKGGDRIGALKALFPGEDLTSDLFWDLAKAVGQEPEAAEVDIKAVVAAQVEAKLRADAEAAAQRVKDQQAAFAANLRSAHEEYVGSCGEVFAANKARFPAIAALGVQSERIRQFVEDEYHPKHGGVPSPLETLQHLEEELTGRIRSTPYAARQEQQAPRAATVSSEWRTDPGRPANDNSANETLDQIRERRRAALRQPR